MIIFKYTSSFSKAIFYYALALFLSFSSVTLAIADEFEVMEGYVMEIDYDKGVFVVLEKYVYLKDSVTKKEGYWGTKVTKENSDTVIPFSSIKEGNIVSVRVSGSEPKLQAEEIMIIETKEKSNTKQNAVNNETSNKKMKKINGVWTN